MVARRAGFVSVASLSGLFATYIFAPLWVKDIGLGVWNAPADREVLRVQNLKSAMLDAKRVHILREVDATSRTTKRLIAGTITLVEAIDELEPMLRQREGFEHAWPHNPPSTFRHAAARFVIARVAIELQADPERLAIVTARLEVDYAALK